MTLYTKDNAAPRKLPFRIKLSDGRTRTDPETFMAEEIADAGYIAAPDKPEADPGKRVEWQDGAWVQVALPPDPAPVPQPLTRVGFARLCMSAGGMTQQMLVDSRADMQLAALWTLLEMATQLEKDDPEIAPGLTALETLGYLPNGADAVLNAWPEA